MGKHISTKIFVFIVLVILVPASLMIGHVKTSMEETLHSVLREKTMQNYAKSEIELDLLFYRMLNISSIFFNDPDLLQVFSDDSFDYWDRTLVFQQVNREIIMQNMYETVVDSFRVTLYDNKNNIYANWNRNYQDYDYLFEQSWVRESHDMQGYVQWSLNSLGYDAVSGAKGETDQIALARSIIGVRPGSTDRIRVGTLLISISKSVVNDILDEYKYSEDDFVFMATTDGAITFSYDVALTKEQLETFAGKKQEKQEGSELVTLDGKKYLLTFYTIQITPLADKNKLRFFSFIDYGEIEAEFLPLIQQVNTGIAIFVLFALGAAFFISIMFTRPIQQLSVLLGQYRPGDVPVVLQHNRQDEIGELYRAFQDMALHNNNLFSKVQSEQKAKDQYYYESLKSKVSPHFLFNTLNTIRWMAVIRKADNIQQCIDALAAILQYSLREDSEMVALGSEVEVIRQYCYIQHVRFGNNYKLYIDISPEVANQPIIKFSIQPLVENCYKYAFEGRETATITIRALCEDNIFMISVIDDGVGFQPEYIQGFGKDKEHKIKGGLGLKTLHWRISSAYGEQYGLRLSNIDGGGACVTLFFPI